MNFAYRTLRIFGLTLFLLPTIAAKSSEESTRSFQSNNISTYQNKINFNFVGEIIGHSYIKINLESILIKSKQDLLHLKGTCYEAISGHEYRVIGSYNIKTLMWKLNCFDNRNAHASIFLGKENKEGDISGKWTKNKAIRDFYLKKAD